MSLIPLCFSLSHTPTPPTHDFSKAPSSIEAEKTPAWLSYLYNTGVHFIEGLLYAKH